MVTAGWPLQGGTAGRCRGLVSRSGLTRAAVLQHDGRVGSEWVEPCPFNRVRVTFVPRCVGFYRARFGVGWEVLGTWSWGEERYPKKGRVGWV